MPVHLQTAKHGHGSGVVSSKCESSVLHDRSRSFVVVPSLPQHKIDQLSGPSARRAFVSRISTAIAMRQSLAR